MGQRHQVYAITNKGTFAWHDQWSYGTLPLRAALRVLTYQKVADEYNKLTSDYLNPSHQTVIERVMTTDYRKGICTGAFDITKELINKEGLIDPRRGDNNDGITILDLRKEEDIRYCFMMLWDEDRGPYTAKAREPLSAEQYVKLYYKPGSERWESLKITPLLKELKESGARLLTRTRCRKLLPGLYDDELELEKILKAKPEELPTFIDNVKYPENITILERRLKGVPA